MEFTVLEASSLHPLPFCFLKRPLSKTLEKIRSPPLPLMARSHRTAGHEGCLEKRLCRFAPSSQKVQVHLNYVPICDLECSRGTRCTGTMSLTPTSVLTQHHSSTGFRVTLSRQRIAEGEVTHSGTTRVAVAKLKPAL